MGYVAILSPISSNAFRLAAPKEKQDEILPEPVEASREEASAETSVGADQQASAYGVKVRKFGGRPQQHDSAGVWEVSKGTATSAAYD